MGANWTATGLTRNFRFGLLNPIEWVHPPIGAGGDKALILELAEAVVKQARGDAAGDALLELPSGKAAVRGRAKQAEQPVVEGGEWIKRSKAVEDGALGAPGDTAGSRIDGIVQNPE